jgi:hypothetical protein
MGGAHFLLILPPYLSALAWGMQNNIKTNKLI